MKRTAISFLVACMLLSAGAFAQTMTLSYKNVPLDSVFREVEKQTNYAYTFVYNPDWLHIAKKVTVEGTDMTLNQVLNKCFANQPFTYAISGSIITIIARGPEDKLISPPGTIITGKVTGVDSLPLRASIQVEGTKIGTVADENGFFKLETSRKNVNLQISHIGYEPKSINAANGFTTINLEVEPKYLDEVVKKGYTTSSRRFNLGTVTKIGADDLARQPNILAGMQGRVAGMVLNQNSGLPGAAFTAQIRGQRSIGTTPGQLPANSPLFVIDGVPFLSTSETLMQRTNHGVTAFSPFSTINPADIESVEILKDANATSLYGSLGANGVVLISTKRPNRGNSVEVNISAGSARVTRMMDYMNKEQYLQLRREAFLNDGAIPNDPSAYDFLVWDTNREIDWKKSLIGGSTRVSSANVRISGGSDRTNFTGSVGYNKESTLFPLYTHGKSLASLSFQLNHVSKDNKLEFNIASSYGFDKSHLPFQDPATLINMAPNAPPPYTPDGKLTFEEEGFDYANPHIFLHQPNKLTMERITVSARMSYKLFPWMNLKATVGKTVITGEETTKFYRYSLNPKISTTGSAIFGDNKNSNWIAEPQAEFTWNIGPKSRWKALIGTSFREQVAKSDLVAASGYPDDGLMNSLSGATSVTFSTDSRQYRIHSVYALVNHTWDNKYLFEINGRRDGSSRFGPDRQFANFGSIGAGWIFSKESFIQDKLPVISFGKLRMTYGTTGNDQIGDYQYFDVWVNTQTQTQHPYQIATFKPSRLYNNDYSWEQHKSLELGLDLGLFDDRVLLSGVWSQSRTSNQLLGISLPTQTGFNSILKNFPAIVQNNNIELELNTVNINQKNFKWKTSANISFPKNKLVKFPGLSTSQYGQVYRAGMPLNLIWGYRSAGVNPTTGLYQILDRNGNVIDIPTVHPKPEDIVPLGTYNPDYYGGIVNSIQYHNWQLDFLFQFVKQKGKDPIILKAESVGFPLFNQPLALLQRWARPGDIVPYQRATQDFGSPAAMSALYYAMSDATITDASYIRLKNLSLSYNIPRKWREKLKLNHASIYVQGQNLLTFTSYIGNDPETSSINPDGLPPLRVISVGIRASL